MLLDRVDRFIRRHDLIRPGQLVLAGVSGGPDSIFLLTALAMILPAYPARLHVLHLDHGLRGRESGDDAVFVSFVANTLDLPCTVVRRQVAIEGRPGLSTQENARAVRLAFFREMREELKGDSVALGHNADDQAETVLLRLLTCGGPGALAGIRPRGPGCIIHPLLEVTREEILGFLRAEKIDFRTDRTNLEDKYLRNRIRHRLMPVIREINPSFHRRAGTLCDLLCDEDNYLQAKAAEVYRSLAAEEDDSLSLPLADVAALHRALARRVIVTAARRAGSPAKHLGARHVDSVLQLIEKPAGGSVDLPGSVTARAASGRLVLGKRPGGKPPFPGRTVRLPGLTGLPELGLEVETQPVPAPSPDDIPRDPLTALIDGDRLTGPLTVRVRRNGDRFRPLGLAHSQKLHDFLINRKVARHRRDRLPIFCDGEKIVWVGGLRLDDRVKITKETRRAWRLCLRPA